MYNEPDVNPTKALPRARSKEATPCAAPAMPHKASFLEPFEGKGKQEGQTLHWQLASVLSISFATKLCFFHSQVR